MTRAGGADTREPFPCVPDVIPLAMQDMAIMRCTACGDVVPGMWPINRKTMAAGIDHLLDEHRADLVAGRLLPPLFVNCAIQDPFWFDEHASPRRKSFGGGA